MRLTFPTDLVRQPIIGRLAQQFGVLANIRRADIAEDVGWIVCELDGEPASVADAIAWMEEIGVHVDRIEHPLEG